jgi:hypothetical protein
LNSISIDNIDNKCSPLTLSQFIRSELNLVFSVKQILLISKILRSNMLNSICYIQSMIRVLGINMYYSFCVYINSKCIPIVFRVMVWAERNYIIRLVKLSP